MLTWARVIILVIAVVLGAASALALHRGPDRVDAAKLCLSLQLGDELPEACVPLP